MRPFTPDERSELLGLVVSTDRQTAGRRVDFLEMWCSSFADMLLSVSLHPEREAGLRRRLRKIGKSATQLLELVADFPFQSWMLFESPGQQALRELINGNKRYANQDADEKRGAFCQALIDLRESADTAAASIVVPRGAPRNEGPCLFLEQLCRQLMLAGGVPYGTGEQSRMVRAIRIVWCALGRDDDPRDYLRTIDKGGLRGNLERQIMPTAECFQRQTKQTRGRKSNGTSTNEPLTYRLVK